MQRRTLHRGGIRSAGYDSQLRALDVEFETRRIVRYENVGRETAERFLSCAHPASFLADEIEENYTSHEISDAESLGADKETRAKQLDALKALFGD